MIANSGHDENNRYKGGKAGDQTGGEWDIIDWYNRPWEEVYRHPDHKVREKIAELAEKAAKNNCIGYDQGQRWTFWDELKKNGYDPSKITKNCEQDCSSGVLSVCKAVGYLLNNEKLKAIDQNGYTGNQGSILKKAGFEKLTDKKYLTSDAYLLRGDIPLYPFHHTAINLTDGKYSGSNNSADVKPETNVEVTLTETQRDKISKGQRWLNSNYGALLETEKGSKLEVDGSYGPKSRAAALCVWKDVVNRKYGYNLTPSNENFYDSCLKAAEDAVIQKGASGTLPYIVQFILAAKGFYSDSMDANFGGKTEAAVKEYQRRTGLAVTGKVTPETWYKMFN